MWILYSPPNEPQRLGRTKFSNTYMQVQSIQKKKLRHSLCSKIGLILTYFIFLFLLNSKALSYGVCCILQNNSLSRKFTDFKEFENWRTLEILKKCLYSQMQIFINFEESIIILECQEVSVCKSKIIIFKIFFKGQKKVHLVNFLVLREFFQNFSTSNISTSVSINNNRKPLKKLFFDLYFYSLALQHQWQTQEGREL